MCANRTTKCPRRNSVKFWMRKWIRGWASSSKKSIGFRSGVKVALTSMISCWRTWRWTRLTRCETITNCLGRDPRRTSCKRNWTDLSILFNKRRKWGFKRKFTSWSRAKILRWWKFSKPKLSWRINSTVQSMKWTRNLTFKSKKLTNLTNLWRTQSCEFWANSTNSGTRTSRCLKIFKKR